MRNYCIAIGSYAPAGYPAIYKTEDILENIRKAHNFGYAGIEWHLKAPNNGDIIRVTKLCESLDMPITSIGTGMACAYDGLSLMHTDSEVRMQTVVRLKEFIDMGAQLGSIVIIGSIKGSIPVGGVKEIYEAYLNDNLKIVMDYAEKKNVQVVLEVLNRYECNLLNTAEQMNEFIEKFGSSLLKTHLDTFHMNIEEPNMCESISNCKTLGHIHFADSNRMYPGAGHIDFSRIEHELKRKGFQGNIAIECLPYPEPDVAAKKTIEYLKCVNQNT
jgi:sugar phosphate isomerase/epimerase